MEEWKEINGYEYYQISNTGKVKSLEMKLQFGNRFRIKPEIILKNRITRHGYSSVNLYSNKKMSSKEIHRLVAEAFILNPDNLPEVNHKDCDKQNNNLWNLEWCTRRENVIHAHSNKLYYYEK